MKLFKKLTKEELKAQNERTKKVFVYGIMFMMAGLFAACIGVAIVGVVAL